MVWLAFSFSVKNTSPVSAQIRVEYGIDYQTLSGKTSAKIFKIKELNLERGQTLDIARAQRFQDFTTRKHYVGSHTFRVLVNGTVLAEQDFEVIAPRK